MLHEFMLTVEAGKKLIAKGLAADAEFREALRERRVLIVAGTTNAYVAREALAYTGDGTPFDAASFHRGVTVPRGVSAPGGRFEGDILIERGKAFFGRDVFEEAPKLEAGDVVLKGANAVYLPGGEAGVLIGNPKGGTAVPIVTAVIGRRAKLIVPVGLEKRVEAPIAQLSRLVGEAGADGPRLMPLPGRVFTEIDAVRALTGAQAALVASGGICGAEGCVYLAAKGTEEQIASLKRALEAVG